VSKFGSDDGSNSNDPKRDQASVDGFRLDSSQSSWLMDRLGALDEEDKLSLSNSAAQVQMPEVHMSDNPDDPTPHYHDQQPQQQNSEPPRDNVSHLQPVHNQAPPQNQMNSKKVPGAPVQPTHQPRQYVDQLGEVDSESALLLRQKIENLEHQLAEISDLTGEQRAKYVEELTQPHGRGPVGPPHLQGGEFDEDVSMTDETHEPYGAHSQGFEQEGYSSHAPEQHYQAPGDHSQYAPSHEQETSHSHGEGYAHETGINETGANVNHGNDPLTMVPDYSDHPHQHETAHPHERGVPLTSREVQLHSDEQRGYEQNTHHDAYIPRQGGHVQGGHTQGIQAQGVQAQGVQGGAHPHMQQGGQVQRSPHQQDYAELPQFLAPIQQEKKSRPAYLAVLGSVGALLVAGGIAYTYLNGGVSDVIKSDLSSSRFKESSKLSDATDRVDQSSVKKTEIEVAKVAPKLDLKQGFSINPLEGTAGQNLPLKIQLPNDTRLSSAFLVVRNLPDWAKLNYGRQMNGLWMVSVSQANELEMIIPEDQPGKFAFEIDLVVNAGDAPVTKKVTADIAPYQAPETKKPEQPEVTVPVSEERQEVASVETDNSELIKQPGVGAQKGPLIIDQALEEKWLERGTRLLRAGDVSAARLAFSHLAEQGSGRAALAMGMTFDPNQPSARVVSGIKLDKKRARFWYQRALSLGHEGARDPLRQLDR